MSTVTTADTALDGSDAFGAYGLLDAESANILGTYDSEASALRVVAELVQRYGPSSPAVAALVLYHNDGPEDESVLAEGNELIQRALTLTDVSHKVSRVLNDSSRGNGPALRSGSPRATSQRRRRR